MAGLTAVLFIVFTAYKLYEEAIPRLLRAEETTYENLGLAAGTVVASMVIAEFLARLERTPLMVRVFGVHEIRAEYGDQTSFIPGCTSRWLA